MRGRDTFVAALGALAVTALAWGAAATTRAAEPDLKVYPEGEPPRDVRLGGLRTLDDQFPFTPVSTKEEWAERAHALHRRVRVANGL